MLNLTESHILSLPAYSAGASIDKHLSVKKWSKLASNENPLGASRHALMAIKNELKNINIYPVLNRNETIKQICDYYKDFSISNQNVALGNGSTELIINLIKALVNSSEIVLTGWPTFIMYRLAIMAQGRKEISVPLKNLTYDLESMNHVLKENSQIKLLFLANPNNPTGTYVSKDELLSFIKKLSLDIVLILDEAYFEYVEKKDYLDGLTIALERPRTLILRTFSKVYGLAGIRMGYAIGDKEIISALNKIADPFNTNSLAQVAAIESLKDKDHLIKSIVHNNAMKPLLISKLIELGFLVNMSEGNFVLAQRSNYMPTIANIYKQLFNKGVIIRPLDAYDMQDYMRISVGTHEQIEHLITELKIII